MTMRNRRTTNVESVQDQQQQRQQQQQQHEHEHDDDNYNEDGYEYDNDYNNNTIENNNNTNDNNDDITLSEPSHMILISSFPFFFMGNWYIGLILLVLGLIGMFITAINDISTTNNNNNTNTKVPQTIKSLRVHNDATSVEFDSLDSNNILQEMIQLISTITTNSNRSSGETTEKSRVKQDLQKQQQQQQQQQPKQQQQQQQQISKKEIEKINLLLVAFLNELMLRYSISLSNISNNSNSNNNSTTTTTTTKSIVQAENNNIDDTTILLQVRVEQETETELNYNTSLALICHDAAYSTLNLYHHSVSTDDNTTVKNDTNHYTVLVATSLSTLALLGKHPAVRQRYLIQPDTYGLHIPINALRKSLQYAKTISSIDSTNSNDNDAINDDDNTNNEQEIEEEKYAEIQRRGCLFLGSISDGNIELSQLVVQQGGIEVIIDAMDWYRYHINIAHWSLWSLFTICYNDTIYNKIQLIQYNGIQIILQTLQNNCGIDNNDNNNNNNNDDQEEEEDTTTSTTNLEITRLGIALLFDIIVRQSYYYSSDTSNDTIGKLGTTVPKMDTDKIRTVALANGMGTIVYTIYNKYNVQNNNDTNNTAKNLDIISMSRELLRTTQYEKYLI